MRIRYCEECNKRVTDGEISEGLGVRAGELVYCEECAKAKNIGREPPAERRKEKTSRRTRASSRRSRVERSFVRGMPRWVYAAGLLAALAVVVLVAVSLRGTGARGRNRLVLVPLKPPLPDEPAPVPGPESAAPAREADAAPARAPEPAAPVPQAPAPQAPVAAPAAAATFPVEGQVIFVSDFERDANGWEHGKRVEDPSLPDSRWAYQSTFVPSRFLSRRVMLARYGLKPRRDSIFETGKGLYVAFDYLVSGDAASPDMEVVFCLVVGGSGQNWRYNVEGVAKDRWSTAKLSVMEDLMYIPEKGKRTPTGARVNELKIGVGPANAKLELRVDNVRVIDAGATGGG